MGVKVAAACALAWMVVLSVYDIRDRRLPNWLTMPGAAMVLAVAAEHGRGTSAALGAVALFTVYLSVHLLVPRAMGAGDVKLAIGLGALTGSFGVDVWVLAALGAQVLTAVGALAFRAESTVPHGPSMCLAAAGAVALAVA